MNVLALLLVIVAIYGAVWLCGLTEPDEDDDCGCDPPAAQAKEE